MQLGTAEEAVEGGRGSFSEAGSDDEGEEEEDYADTDKDIEVLPKLMIVLLRIYLLLLLSVLSMDGFFLPTWLH